MVCEQAEAEVLLTHGTEGSVKRKCQQE